MSPDCRHGVVTIRVFQVNRFTKPSLLHHRGEFREIGYAAMLRSASQAPSFCAPAESRRARPFRVAMVSLAIFHVNLNMEAPCFVTCG